MKVKLAIIGANEFQTKLILKCKENNIETHVFAWEEGAVGKAECDFFYAISIIDKERILKKCIEIGIDGVLSIGSDLAIITVNYIAEKMNLIGNSIECTDVSTNKYEMRKAFLENNVSSPLFVKISDNEEWKNSIKFEVPIIVKPTDRSGSRGVIKVENLDFLQGAICLAMKESFNKKVIVEQYISGKEYSMEFFSDSGKHKFLAITEKFTTGAPNFIEKAHLQPGRINQETLKKAIEIAKQGLDALKVENGASHIEIKVDNGEVIIIEIGARMGGDFIGSDLVRLSTGIDFTKLVLDKALNRSTNICAKHNKYSFVYFIFTKADLLKIKENYNLLKQNIVEENLEEKNMYDSVTDSSNRHGYVIFSFDKYSEFKNVEDILL